VDSPLLDMGLGGNLGRRSRHTLGEGFRARGSGGWSSVSVNRGGACARVAPGVRVDQKLEFGRGVRVARFRLRRGPDSISGRQVSASDDVIVARV